MRRTRRAPKTTAILEPALVGPAGEDQQEFGQQQERLPAYAPGVRTEDGGKNAVPVDEGDTAGLPGIAGAEAHGRAGQLAFPMCLEQPSDAVEHVTRQVSVAASELAFYDFTSRAAKRHSASCGI
ncbi:hypothetical protein [Streptomyces sp. NPDC051677]|uniref:hypothetical protein n=1 Tax=Streptomyces sp. NPDC051677 TaxID=3365669 RepID=UPI0037D85D1F